MCLWLAADKKWDMVAVKAFGFNTLHSPQHAHPATGPQPRTPRTPRTTPTKDEMRI